MIRFLTFFFLALSLGALPACTHAADGTGGQSASSHTQDEPRPYDASRDARADVAAAKLRAQEAGKMTIVAMGANWCHDSRGFAAQFEKPRFQTLLEDHFELVYVDVGKRDRNIDLAREFGVEAIYGTPTVFVLSPDWKVLNLEDAPTWRNAHSRSEDEVYDYFAGFATEE